MKQAQDCSVEMAVKNAITGQAGAQKFTWLPSINIQFKTIYAR